MEEDLKTGLCFDDVLLKPQYSSIRSRKSDVSLNSELGRWGFRLPVISSPMDTVTEVDMAYAMASRGGLGVIHRYNSPKEQAAMASLLFEMFENESTQGLNPVAVAIGVTGDFMERADLCFEAGARVFCVDIAHGHHALMKDALSAVRMKFGSRVHIMAGNVATLEGFNDLSDWGADSIRVGIGGGSICSTRIQTGHGMPTLASILECAASDRPAALIADGGMRNSGDVVKALAAGADFVMLGSMLSGTEEAPGDVTFRDGVPYKSYRGMASVEAQIDWRGHTASVEGVSSYVASKGPLCDVLCMLETGIRSGLSYSGAHTLSVLRAKSRFIKQTTAGSIESSTHINKVT